ncbi:MAG: hypothetical protein MUF87_20905 [Anaerolineae bacterium]|nr:hypothetical protein [Anaerolineae bacterium]
MNSIPSSGKKNEAYLLTLGDHATRCIVGWAVSLSCDQTQWQAVLDATPRVVLDYSDGSPTHLVLLDHPSIHLTFTDKSQTYRVEGDNADYAVIWHFLRVAHGVSLGA